MALAVEQGTTFAEQQARGYALQAKFRNSTMPAVVSQADAMLKIVQAVPWFTESDVLLEELGFSDNQIQRLRSDRAKAARRQLVAQYAGSLGIASDPRNAAKEVAADDSGR